MLAFCPPETSTILIVGQDVDSIDAYSRGVGSKPGGVTGYTSLAQLNGITGSVDNGGGRNYLDYLANNYPQSAIVVGLYLKDYLDDIVSGGADREIDWLIDKLESYGRPAYVRFGYEF